MLYLHKIICLVVVVVVVVIEKAYSSMISCLFFNNIFDLLTTAKENVAFIWVFSRKNT